MVNPSPETRYSVPGKPDIGAAKNFSWEHPIPVNDFWNSLEFVAGRNFLRCFSPDELKEMNLEGQGSLDDTAKLRLLLSLLEAKLVSENAKAAPDALLDVNFDLWNNLLLGIQTMHGYLGNIDEEERVTRLLVEKRRDTSNLSHLHSLSVVLEKKGKWSEAIETETAVREWLDGRLGAYSPQALSSRRIIARATWKQGKELEARRLVAEVLSLIESSGNSKYAVYQEEQKTITETMLAAF